MRPSRESQKSSERVYLQRFMALAGWDATVQDSESPDFLVRFPGSSTGVEVTELLKDEEPHVGSIAKLGEKRRARWLREVADEYYSAGGQPVLVKALWADGLEVLPSPDLASRFIHTRESLSDWMRAQMFISPAESYYLTALPEAAGEYSRWSCIGDIVGWIRPVSEGELATKIRSKSAKLPAYRRKVDRMVLLIVADRLTNAGRWCLTPSFTPIDGGGFDEVHLLLHPEETHRIDRGPAS